MQMRKNCSLPPRNSKTNQKKTDTCEQPLDSTAYCNYSLFYSAHWTVLPKLAKESFEDKFWP